MRYTEAVRTGMERAEKAAELLRSITGYSKPGLFLKPVPGRYEPVGEETLYAIIARGKFVQIALVDRDGVVKATSQLVTEKALTEFLEKLEEKGIERYRGKVYLF